MYTMVTLEILSTDKTTETIAPKTTTNEKNIETVVPERRRSMGLMPDTQSLNQNSSPNVAEGTIASGKIPILNLLPSTPDSRDYEYIVSSASSVSSASHTKYLRQCRDQGTVQGSCAPQVLCAMQEYRINKRNIDAGINTKLIRCSPQLTFDCRDDLKTNGMTCRDAMKYMKRYGTCLEEDYPYYPDYQVMALDAIKNKISIDTLKSTSDYRIDTYECIKKYTDYNSNAVKNTDANQKEMDNLKDYLGKHGPCLVAFPVYSGSMDGKLWIEKGDKLGGHAVCIVGYDDVTQHFIIRNSWGETWGPHENGHVEWPYNEFHKAWEIWTFRNGDDMVTKSKEVAVSKDEDSNCKAIIGSIIKTIIENIPFAN